MAATRLFPAVSSRPHRITVAEFERMLAAKVWPDDERLELMEGELISMSPIYPPHAVAVAALTRIFSAGLHQRVLVWAQNPIRLDRHSRPQPDVALVKPLEEQYRGQLPGPEDVFLLVEVSDSTLRYDRQRKLPLYARAGIPEVWIVDVKAGQIAAYRAPQNGDYTQVATYARGQTLAPEAFADLAVNVEDVVGQRTGE